LKHKEVIPGKEIGVKNMVYKSTPTVHSETNHP